MSLDLVNKIICSPQNLTTLKQRYPKREIIADPLCEDDKAYYETKTGEFRTLYILDFSIWKSLEDENGDPIGYIKRVR